MPCPRNPFPPSGLIKDGIPRLPDAPSRPLRVFTTFVRNAFSSYFPDGRGEWPGSGRRRLPDCSLTSFHGLRATFPPCWIAKRAGNCSFPSYRKAPPWGMEGEGFAREYSPWGILCSLGERPVSCSSDAIPPGECPGGTGNTSFRGRQISFPGVVALFPAPRMPFLLGNVLEGRGMLPSEVAGSHSPELSGRSLLLRCHSPWGTFEKDGGMLRSEVFGSHSPWGMGRSPDRSTAF
jgi:hypothetical protein